MLSVHCNSCVVKRGQQSITKIKIFINKYNWKGKMFLPEKDDWKKNEKNNITITLNALPAKKKKYILLMF